TGIGSALLNVAVAKMVADWFTGKEMPTAMGVMLTSFPVGMALAMGVLGHIGTAYTWRVAVHATALAAAVACLLAIALYRNPATTTRHGARPATGPMGARDVALSARAGPSGGLFNAWIAVLRI